MENEYSRNQHKSAVISFLQKHVENQTWEVELPPHGTGQETYFVRNDKQSFFIKLGAKTERYQVMAKLGLAPEVITFGELEDSTSILVQHQVCGKKPSRKDFHQLWLKFAECIRITHQSGELKQVLPKRSSNRHQDVGFEILAEIEERWAQYKSQVSEFADYVDQNIQYLRNQVGQFPDSGLVASHNDVCNGNWLVASDGNIYLLDYESMSLDDPALDLGAILWWYYPPEMRMDFLRVVGYKDQAGFQNRMRIRMAIHNLNIIIPRKDSFDRFRAETFDNALVDFRAVINGRENPQGSYA